MDGWKGGMDGMDRWEWGNGWLVGEMRMGGSEWMDEKGGWMDRWEWVDGWDWGNGWIDVNGGWMDRCD